MMNQPHIGSRSRLVLRLAAFTLCLGAAVFTGPVLAEVADLEIDQREPFADGHTFGASGAYERIKGSVWIEVDPSHAANRHVVDLNLAPKTAAGRVRFRTDFFLLKPVDAARGNGRLLYDVNNRGDKLALWAFNEARGNDPKSLADAGNGFLMREGYSVLWCGWNGDVKPGEDRLLLDLPVAVETTADGTRSITGKVYSEIFVDARSFSEPLCWGNSRVYPAADLNEPEATLTMRPNRSAPATRIPRDQWSFARWENGTAIPDATHLYIKEGFRSGWLYDFVYTAKDPRVSGLGAVAMRDIVSFFRFAKADRQGRANPLTGEIEHAYVFGISQSGRFTNYYLYQNFNGDEQDRTVFDGAFIHVGGAGKAVFNRRFAQLTRHGSQHEENLYPSDPFPYNTVPQDDPVTGQHGDFLGRSRRSGHLPKIILTQTSTEYWGRGGSLLHTDAEGRRDVELDPNVRMYHIASAHHLFFLPPDRGVNQHPLNTLDYVPLLRALLVVLDEWVTKETPPPPSRYPRIDDGTLVDVEAYRGMFPAIPGVQAPSVLYRPLRLDLGPRWDSDGIADELPPRAGKPYQTRVPAVDKDGNEIAGIFMPDSAVPLGTHVGWNQRAPEFGAAGMLGRWVGASWPFPVTPAQRERDNDPRRSVMERYATKEEYVAKVKATAEQLLRERFLLEEDVERILKTAAELSLWNAPRE